MSPRRRDTIFIQVDVRMPNHPKVFGLSDSAFRVLVTSWCYCREYVTDGFVVAAVWNRHPAKARRELIEAGLAHEADGGVTMHDFTEHQQSRAEIEEFRAKQAQNGAKGGRPKKDRAGTQEKPSGFPNENPDGTQMKAESETEIEEEANASSSDAPRPDVESLCTLLADLIQANGSKRPSLTKRWRDAARLMLDRDGRDVAKAAELIRWCQADEFWRGNVLSMPTFREKYDQLRLKAIEDWQSGKARGASPQPLDDARARRRSWEAEMRAKHAVGVIFDDDTEETIAARAQQGVAS